MGQLGLGLGLGQLSQRMEAGQAKGAVELSAAGLGGTGIAQGISQATLGGSIGDVLSKAREIGGGSLGGGGGTFKNLQAASKELMKYGHVESTSI